MGVPALFRWLSTKYPKIISNVVEEQPVEVDGVKTPVSMAGQNPNGEEFDNLYLDMNGIVHPCSHPEDKPAPETEEQMMKDIFEYTERVVNMVRPRRVLMMAVDGVAPRAKMNQQRSRRFRSAQEAKEKDEQKAEFLKLLKSQQKDGPVSDEAEAHMTKKTWDSNAITPGTPFMRLLAESLKYWAAWKLNNDPAWKNLKVIISDASVPGEGEHKIMEFVRSQRRSPDHDPNTRHVIYGLDADLIMLGLATHEPHFRVLREDVFFQDTKAKTCRLCGQVGHYADQCKGEIKKKEGEFDEKSKMAGPKPFIWLHVGILREYLEAELTVPNQGFRFDLERALDDWVFMCFFVGNDFLPHLPSLDIRENGIDTLIAIWRDNIPSMGGYVTKDGHVDLDRAQCILSGLAKQESAIFKRRKETDDRKAAAEKRRAEQRAQRRGPRFSNGNQNGNQNGTPKGKFDDFSNFAPVEGATGAMITHDMVVNRQATIAQANVANKSAAAVLKEKLKTQNGATDSPDSNANGDSGPASQDGHPTPPSALGKRKADLLDDDPSTPGRNTPDVPTPKKEEGAMPEDTVRLWEDGYEERYYEQKFGKDPQDIEFRHQVGRDYVEGLAWVLLYYMQGCPSWTWYYPHHYAPFAADCVDLGKMTIKFNKGQPFRPYEQLMGVMPAASNHTIPEPFHSLMTDEDSDIVDFYPEDFRIDLNGKKFAWQGVAILPFIDEKRLLAAMATKYPLLTEDEVQRNEFGQDTLLFSKNHPLHSTITKEFMGKNAEALRVSLNPKESDYLIGTVIKDDDFLPFTELVSPIGDYLTPVPSDSSMRVFYEFPKSTNIHKSMLLRGVKMPAPVLDAADLDGTRNRAGRSGRSFGGVPLREDRNGNGYNNHHGNRGGSINYSNPFAAHLNPNFNPGTMNRAPPPPHIAAAQGWVPPPPPSMQASGAYWNGQGYNTSGGNNWGYKGPPGQQQQQYGGGGGGGGYGGGRDDYRRDDGYRRRDDDRNRDGHGYGGGRDRNYGRGGGYQGGRDRYGR